jgi:hypothetical protein
MYSVTVECIVNGEMREDLTGNGRSITCAYNLVSDLRGTLTCLVEISCRM